MDCANAEFLAEKEHVSIIPNFSSPVIRLLGGEVGPFEAGVSTSVPIWIAVYLKQRQKCQFISPDWLTTEKLEVIKDAEVNGSLFVKLPSEHFMEITQLILQHGGGDIMDVDNIKTLICDIADARMAKLRSSMDMSMKNEFIYAQINNLTPFEICRIRDFYTTSLDQLQLLQQAAVQKPNTADQSSLM